MLCVALVTYSQTQKNTKTDGNNGYLAVSFFSNTWNPYTNEWIHLIDAHNVTTEGSNYQSLIVQVECDGYVQVYQIDQYDLGFPINFNYGSPQSKKVKITLLNVNAPPIILNVPNQ